MIAYLLGVYTAKLTASRVVLILLLVCIAPAAVRGEDTGQSGWADCAPIDHSDEYEYRYGRADDARTDAQLRELYEKPTVRESSATRTNELGARIDTMTETHVVFATAVDHLIATLMGDERLTSFMPNLSEHELVCKPVENTYRQRQVTDFGVLMFKLGTEYVIDVQVLEDGPGDFASRWVLVESLDDRIAYVYGSWYFESLELDGRTVTYARHYVRSGLTTRVPGVRVFIARRLDKEIRNLFSAFYDETVRRFGRTIASASRRAP